MGHCMNKRSFVPKVWPHARMRRGSRLFVACLSVGLLAACAQPKSLYSWQSYQPMVYVYLQEEGEDYAVQIQTLEENVQSARATDQALPPGFRAHLGMLYLKTGDGTKAVEQWQGEKQAFPESAPFMDFLLRNTTAQLEKTASNQQEILP